jgi:hypothetical protein
LELFEGSNVAVELFRTTKDMALIERIGVKLRGASRLRVCAFNFFALQIDSPPVAK